MKIIICSKFRRISAMFINKFRDQQLITIEIKVSLFNTFWREKKTNIRDPQKHIYIYIYIRNHTRYIIQRRPRNKTAVVIYTMYMLYVRSLIMSHLTVLQTCTNGETFSVCKRSFRKGK